MCTSAKAATLMLSLLLLALALALALFLTGGLFFALSFSPITSPSLSLSRSVSSSLVTGNDSSPLVPRDCSSHRLLDERKSNSAKEKDVFFWRPFEAMRIANRSTATLEELLMALEEDSVQDRERENQLTDNEDHDDDDDEEKHEQLREQEHTHTHTHSSIIHSPSDDENTFSAAAEANITSTTAQYPLNSASLAVLQRWFEYKLNLCAAELYILFPFETKRLRTYRDTARVIDEKREDIENILAFSDEKRLFPVCESLFVMVGQYGEIEIERLYEYMLEYSDDDNDDY